MEYIGIFVLRFIKLRGYIFVFVKPLKGWRRIEALEQRTKKDFASDGKAAA